jgi:hypothetical protein
MADRTGRRAAADVSAALGHRQPVAACAKCDRPDRRFTAKDKTVCTDCRNEARQLRRHGGGELSEFVAALIEDLRAARAAVYSHHVDMALALGICIVRVERFAEAWRRA